MARVSRAKPSERGEPEEWKRGAHRARAIRVNVAAQLGTHITEADLTGSSELVSLRIRGLVSAQRSGDPLVLRSALMDLAAASAAYACHIDFENADVKTEAPRSSRVR